MQTVSLSDLFSKNPTELTLEERTLIVAALRQERGEFVKEQKVTKASGKRNPKGPRPDKVVTIDSLGEIEL